MDRRIQYTKKVIQESLMDLLEEKDITKVTVMELCQRADINRATFYRYYIDIFDLLEHMEEDFVSAYQNSYKDFNIKNKGLYDYVYSLLQACYDNKRFVKILFQTKRGLSVLNELLEDAYIRCKEKWEHDIPDVEEQKEEFATVYMFNGTLGIVHYWIQRDFDKSIPEIAEEVKTLCYYGVNKYIYGK